MALHSRLKYHHDDHLRCALCLWQQLWREYHRWICHNPAAGRPGEYVYRHRRHAYVPESASADGRGESSSPVWASRRFDCQDCSSTAQQCRVTATGYQGSDKACPRYRYGLGTCNSAGRSDLAFRDSNPVRGICVRGDLNGSGRDSQVVINDLCHLFVF